MGITIMGVICVVSNAVVMGCLTRMYLKSTMTVKTINTYVLGTFCCAPTILLVSLFIIMRPEREKNISEQGYKEGISQQWIQRVDTVWTPKKK